MRKTSLEIAFFGNILGYYAYKSDELSNMSLLNVFQIYNVNKNGELTQQKNSNSIKWTKLTELLYIL